MRPSGLFAGLLWAGFVTAQQVPFIPITGPNAPKGAAYLFEDHRGGLWLGGFEGFRGLRYFDGSRFSIPVTDSFSDIMISEIAEDGEGGIWLAAHERGLYRVFHGRMQKMADGVGVPGITSIAPNVLLANLAKRDKEPEEFNLTRIAKVNGTWTAEPMTKSVPGVHFQPDGAGSVLYPCEEGYCEVRISDVTNWRSGMALPVVRHRMKIPSPAVFAMRDHLGCVWLRNDFQAVYQCPGDPAPVTLPYSVAGVGIGGGGLAELDNGSVVIPSFGRLAIGRPGNFRVVTVANGYPSFGALLVGRDGSIWLSNASGLFVFPSRLRMEYWTQRDGLDGNTWSILPLGRKVFAISGDNIQVLDRDRSRWHLLMEFGGATHLMAGPQNTVFVSSRTQGVMQMSVSGKVLRKSVPGNVMMLAQGADGQIWSTGSEISRVRVSGSRLTLDTVKALAPEGHGMDIKIDRGGTLWNCYAGGLLYGRDTTWHRLSQKDGLVSNGCLSVAIDLGGDVWYGAGDNARISRAQSPRPVIQSLSRTEEAGYRAPLFFGVDNGGRIWRGTPNGAYVADPELGRRGEWLHLNQEDGLPGIDANQRSFVADSDGSVWFGIDSSVVHLFPADDMVHPAYAPAVFVSGFSWNGGPFQMADRIGGIEHDVNLTAHIGSLQMDRRNAMHSRYRVLPERRAWTAAHNLDLPLGKLPWGTHTLEVQASLGAGPWSASSVKSFEVLKPFWLTSTGLLGFAFAGALAAAGGNRWRKTRRKRAQTPLPGLGEWRAAVLSPEFQEFGETVLDGRFEVRGVVARGGFATVWEGRDREQKGRACAVKVFRRELLENEWMTRRFQQEVSALKQVSHPNVVGIYGHGSVSSGAPYLAMEFIHGKTLRDVLSETRLERAQTASYLRQAASALAQIHAQGICHRDVKPENLMIRSVAAPGMELVLIDFSIAIVQDPDETIHGLSRAAGTLYYMAPEQAVGYANESSDIYSLAKIVIEMLTGERLSTLLPDASINLAARVRELLAALGFGLSAASVDLIASALEFDPARRPNRANDFGVQIACDLESSGLTGHGGRCKGC